MTSSAGPIQFSIFPEPWLHHMEKIFIISVAKIKFKIWRVRFFKKNLPLKIFAMDFQFSRKRVGVDRGIPNPRFPPPLPPLPSPSTPLPSPSSPTSLPLEYFSRPHRKKTKQVISSYNLSFQCMDYYQGFKTVGQFVCLFLRSFVSLFWSFTT